MLTIARLNWPFYFAAIAVALVALAGLFVLPGLWKLPAGLALVGAAYFLFGSLGVSHLVYDRSDLYRWGWLRRVLQGTNVQRAIACHCGFDEVSAALRRDFGNVQWQVLDHFDEKQMTEPSIRRARALFPPGVGTAPSPYNAWAVPAESADIVLGLLAIHELRTEVERGAWFAESRRCLRPGGRVIIAEHVRDVANFFAFGPGFLHFHSPASWTRCWESAGFHCVEQFRITPFVRVFILSAA